MQAWVVLTRECERRRTFFQTLPWSLFHVPSEYVGLVSFMSMRPSIIHSGAAASRLSTDSTDMSSTVSPLPVYTPFSPSTILTNLPRSHSRQYGQADGPSESTTGEDPSLTPEVQYHHSRSRAAAHRARREHTGGRSVLDSLLHTAISFLYSTGTEWVSLLLVGGLGIALVNPSTLLQPFSRHLLKSSRRGSATLSSTASSP